MPSFPDSVFSPATRSAGQTIDASHVNDVQDEIVAIEGGYINATAPLNSSNSTLANLSVPGGSSLATLNVSSGSTFAGDIGCTGTIGSSGSRVKTLWVGQLEASSGVTPTGVPDAVRLELSGAIQVADGTTTAIDWVVQPIATNSSMHSTGTNPSRVTPQSTGLYLCMAEVRWRNAASTEFAVRIEDSSGAAISEGRSRPVSGNNIVSASGIKRYDATGGHVRVVVTVVGSTSSLEAGDNVTHFDVMKL